MNFMQIYLIGFGIIIGVMTLLWFFSLKIKNSSIVDIFWGAGFVIIGWLYFFLTPEGFLLRKIILMILVTIWGLRLTLHIFKRNWKKGEDFRYKKWREESGKVWVWKSYFQVFLLQGFLLWIISAPLLAGQFFGKVDRLIIFDFLGMLIWGIGFFFEAVGDLQLAKFLRDPANKGRIMNQGVWKFTRHPNYFGDSAQWWAFYSFAFAAGGWWVFFSPILMTFLLVRVSGVALLEKTMIMKPGYREYMEQTSAFIPWLPKKHKNSSISS